MIKNFLQSLNVMYSILFNKIYKLQEDKKKSFIKLIYKDSKTVKLIKDNPYLLNKALVGNKIIYKFIFYIIVITVVFLILLIFVDETERLNYFATIYIGLCVTGVIQFVPKAIDLLDEVDHETIYAKDDEKKNLENKDGIENEIVKVLKSIDKKLSCCSSNHRDGKYIGIGKNKVRK